MFNIKNWNQHRPSATLPQILMYSLPTVSVSFLFGGMAVLQGIYAIHFGLSLTTIATVVLIARLFDAISDPLIGYFSDRYYQKRQDRKIFIVLGGVLFIIASWFLYSPPKEVSGQYFLLWFLLFYFAHTLFEIPHLSWGSELSTHSSEKNKVYALRCFCSLLGGLLFFAMPLLPYFETSEYTPQTLRWSVVVASTFLLPTLYFCIKGVPKFPAAHTKYVDKVPNTKVKLAEEVSLIFRNKPLVLMLTTCMFVNIGIGMWATLLFIYVDAYLGLGKQLAYVYLGASCLNLIFLRVWHLLASSLGKQRVWTIGTLLMVLGVVGTGFLSPGDTDWRALTVCIVLSYAGLYTLSLAAPSLLSDIIDYGTWKNRMDRAGTCFSLYAFISKTFGSLGGAASLGIAGWYGFNASLNSHTEATISGMRFAIAWIPASIIFVAAILIFFIPINMRQHAIIRYRLDSKRV